MNRVLTLDAALAHSLAAVVIDGVVVSARSVLRSRDAADPLPAMTEAVLRDAAIAATDLDLIAATVGPGSFTGIRGALALAHGLRLGADAAIVGVTVGEAIAANLAISPTRTLWVAIDSLRGRVFLARDGAISAWPIDALPRPSGPVAVAGDIAAEVAARLAAKDIDTMLTDARRPTPIGIANAARARLLGELPPLPAQPLYIDPPAVSLPSKPPRPHPTR